eukprot:12063111-Alexandrium_andersonii.AAC.1
MSNRACCEAGGSRVGPATKANASCSALRGPAKQPTVADAARNMRERGTAATSGNMFVAQACCT